MPDRWYEGSYGAVYDPDLGDPVTGDMERIKNIRADGSSVQDAIALLTASLGTGSRATLFTLVVDLMRDGTARTYTAVEALALLGATYVEMAAEVLETTPNDLLGSVALRWAQKGFPSR